MWVASSDDSCTEFFDDVEYLVCGDCGETTYKSPSTMPKMAIKPKTTKLVGASDIKSKAVYWLIDGEWEHKGWLLSQVGEDNV